MTQLSLTPFWTSHWLKHSMKSCKIFLLQPWLFTLFYTTFHNNTLQIWQQSLGITCSCIHRNSIWNKETKIKYCCFLFKQPFIFVLIHWTFLKFCISCFSHTLLSWLHCLMLPVSFTGSYTKDEPNFSLAKTAWPRPSKEINHFSRTFEDDY